MAALKPLVWVWESNPDDGRTDGERFAADAGVMLCIRGGVGSNAGGSLDRKAGTIRAILCQRLLRR